jgi:hypothetical protein
VTVFLRVYGYLNGFLPPVRRGSRFRQVLGTHWSVQDALAVVGVPHSRVDVVVVNGTPVDFSYVLEDGDKVALYPAFRSIDLGDIVRAGRRAD